jgi:inosine-uridine nucleoside N-ribohydrolase
MAIQSRNFYERPDPGQLVRTSGQQSVIRWALLIAIVGFARLALGGTVWIDTDVSIGSPIREVDDAYALVLGFHSLELRIAGLSTSYGNASLETTTRIARDLVRRFGAQANLKPEQVFPGAKSAADLGRQTEASETLARILEKNSVTYVALGPLTNLATFLQLHPKLAPRIERVIFLGGQTPGTILALGSNRSFRIHDANVFKDPIAAERLLRSNVPLLLTPVLMSAELTLDQNDLRALHEHPGTAGEFLANQSKVWLWFWTHIPRTNGAPIFDALSVLIAARPDLVTQRRGWARMDEARDLRVSPNQISGARPVRFCSRISPAAKKVVLERLARR